MTNAGHSRCEKQCYIGESLLIINWEDKIWNITVIACMTEYKRLRKSQLWFTRLHVYIYWMALIQNFGEIGQINTTIFILKKRKISSLYVSFNSYWFSQNNVRWNETSIKQHFFLNNYMKMNIHFLAVGIHECVYFNILTFSQYFLNTNLNIFFFLYLFFKIE